jgi:hypothetical protein
MKMYGRCVNRRFMVGKTPPSSSYAMAGPAIQGLCVRIRRGFDVILQVHPAGEIPIRVM